MLMKDNSLLGAIIVFIALLFCVYFYAVGYGKFWYILTVSVTILILCSIGKKNIDNKKRGK